MKIPKGIILVIAGLLLLSFSYQAEAQILKKIKKRTQEKVEDVIVNKTSDKAVDLTAEHLDKILNVNFNPYGGSTEDDKLTNPDLPESYTFEWKYQLSMKRDHPDMKDGMIFDYYLPKDKPYFGYAIELMRSMFTVVDEQKGVTISYIDHGDKPLAIAYKLPGIDDEDSSESEVSGYTLTELPAKTFLGYESIGYQMENTKQRIILYVSTDVPVGFSSMYDAAKDNNFIPNSFKDILKKQGHALLMYGKIIDKEDPDKEIVMECVSLEETIMVKKNSNYTFSES